MMTVFDATLIPIVIALLIGIAVAWWIVAARRARIGRSTGAPGLAEPRTDAEGKLVRPWMDQTPPQEPVAPAPAPAPVARAGDTREGNGIVDEGAAAASDVVGELIGAKVHRELSGAEGSADDLEAMKGIGPKLAARLAELGYTRYDQLARLSPNEVAMLDDKLGAFRGRLARDRVVEQAAYLERGDRDGFEAAFGRLGS